MSRYIQLLISEEFAERVIPDNDSVRLLDDIIDKIDLRKLYLTYSHIGRPSATTPKTMLKILVYANMQRIYSSRDIEKACNRDINFIWLLNGEKAPNYQEIARFRSKRLSECIEDLFYRIVKNLYEIEEINFEHLFVDGTKIEANANKYSFVWKKSINKYEVRLLDKIDKLFPNLCIKYSVSSENAEELLVLLQSMVKVPFVHGRGKRKSELQRDIEQLSGLLSRKEKYEKYQKTFAGRNSFSKTDPDATFMHLKEDHMRNSQLKPAYNLQLAVEGEYITGLDISSERSDQLTLIPLLEKMDKNIGSAYRDVTADAGYESEENYTYFEDKGQTCYIKPQNYERSKTKKFKSNPAFRENMAYDSEKDEYTCQNGRKLKPTYTGIRKSKSGFESEITYYECESCENCSYKKGCTRSKNNRKMQVSKKFISQRQKSLENIISPRGILLRTNRSIQSEGAFGAIKENYKFRQFLLRGSKKVLTEISLLAIAYNINKYHHKIQDNRTGTQLHGKLSV
jgi:transposase